MGLWFALEPCRSSAALSFQPSSHRYAPGEEVVQLEQAQKLRPKPDGREEELGALRGTQQRFVRKADGKGTDFVTVAPGEEAQWDESKAKLEECDPGESAPSRRPANHLLTQCSSQQARSSSFTALCFTGQGEIQATSRVSSTRFTASSAEREKERRQCTTSVTGELTDACTVLCMRK